MKKVPTRLQATLHIRFRLGKGRPSVTTANNEQYIQLIVRRDRRARAMQIQTASFLQN